MRRRLNGMKSALAGESRDHSDHIVVAFACEVLRLKGGTIRISPGRCLGRAGASPNRRELRYVCVQNEFPSRLSEECDHILLTGESGRLDHDLVERHPARTEQCLYLAMQISDPVLRSVGLVSAAPAYTQLDSSQADAWVSGAREQVNSLPPSLNKLRLTIALIKVSIANGDREEAQQRIGKAYDFGEELFEEDLKANPGKFSELADGFDELVDLASVAARQAWLSGGSLNHIRQIRNDVLRARLLVEQAKGMTDARHSNGE